MKLRKLLTMALTVMALVCVTTVGTGAAGDTAEDPTIISNATELKTFLTDETSSNIYGQLSTTIEYDVSVETMNVSSEKVLDLNDKTITIANGTSDIRPIVLSEGTANLTIKNGAFDVGTAAGAIETKTSSAVQLTVDDVAFTNSTSEAMCILAKSSDHVVICNSTFTSSYGSGAIDTSGGAVTVDAVTITQTGTSNHAATGVSAAYGSEVTVTNATIDADGYACYVYSTGGTINIAGGTYSGDEAVLKVNRSSNEMSDASVASTINVYGGTFTGKLEETIDTDYIGGIYLYGGTFHNTGLTEEEFGAYVANEFEATAISGESGGFIVTSTGTIPAGAIVVDSPARLTSAVGAATNDSVIVLGADIDMNDDQMLNAFSIDNSITIDLNGHTLTSKEDNGLFTINTDTTLTLTNSGDAGEVYIKASTIVPSVSTGITNDGTLHIGCDVTNEMKISNSGTITVTADGYIYNDNNITNSGDMNVIGTINNEGSVTNNGTLTIYGEFVNNGSYTNSGFVFGGTVYTWSYLVMEDGGTLTNNGTLTNCYAIVYKSIQTGGGLTDAAVYVEDGGYYYYDDLNIGLNDNWPSCSLYLVDSLVMTSDVTIPTDVTLEIPAGVTLDTGDYTLTADGTLKGTDATSCLVIGADNAYNNLPAGTYVWDAANDAWDMTYTITFTSTRGTPSVATALTGVDGKLATVPTISYSGYSFNGWYDNGTKIGTDTVFTGDITVTASWTQNYVSSTTTTTKPETEVQDDVDTESTTTENEDGSVTVESTTTVTNAETGEVVTTTGTETTVQNEDGSTTSQKAETTTNQTTGEVTSTTATATTTTADDGATVTETVATTTNETTGSVTESVATETVSETATVKEEVATTTSSEGVVAEEKTIVIANTETATEITATVATENGAITSATIVAVATEDTADVTIPQTVLETVATEESATITVQTAEIEIVLDEIATNTVADAVASSADEHVVITAESVDSAVVNEDCTADLDNVQVVDLTITVGGKTVSNLGGGYATVTIPYTKADSDAPVVVYYIADDGTVTVVPDFGYDADSGVIYFTTSHFSYYMVAENNAMSFVDVSVGAYYYDAVKFAVENSITAGTSATTFSPDAICTRGQAVSFLYRAAGEPEVTGEIPFTDVTKDAYYYDAVRWAVSEGITAGTSATTFSPDEICSRSEIVTFLYRVAGAPVVTGGCDFTDMDADSYYYDAVLWAVQNNITSGTSATTFAPDDDCTRGQIVTFLHRYMAETYN